MHTRIPMQPEGGLTPLILMGYGKQILALAALAFLAVLVAGPVLGSQ